MPFTFPFSKLLSFRSKQATLSGIFITDAAGRPMQSRTTAMAISDQGLEDDRYYSKTGYWDPVEGCQVTLITEHDLTLASRGNDLNFDKGQHRRNLVIKGIKTKSLEGKEFRIGDAIFSYDKPRPPCGYLNKIEGKGMALALSYNSGICIRVIQSGKISIHDPVEILPGSNK